MAELRSDSNSSRELIPRSTPPPKPVGNIMKTVVQESCYVAKAQPAMQESGDAEGSCAGELR